MPFQVNRNSIPFWYEPILRCIAGGGQVCLVVQPGGRVERTLRLIGLDRLCPMFATVRQAWNGRGEAGGAALDRAA